MNGYKYKVNIYYMLFSRLLKYNSRVKLSEYNFHCSRTIFGGRIELISLINGIFSGIMLS